MWFAQHVQSIVANYWLLVRGRNSGLNNVFWCQRSIILTISSSANWRGVQFKNWATKLFFLDCQPLTRWFGLCFAGGCPVISKPMADRSCDPPCTKPRSLCTEVSFGLSHKPASAVLLHCCPNGIPLWAVRGGIEWLDSGFLLYVFCFVFFGTQAFLGLCFILTSLVISSLLDVSACQI